MHGGRSPPGVAPTAGAIWVGSWSGCMRGRVFLIKSVGLTRCAGVVWDQLRVRPTSEHERCSCRACPSSPVGAGSNLRRTLQWAATLHRFPSDQPREFHALVRDRIQPLIAAGPQRCPQPVDTTDILKQTKPILAKSVPYARRLHPGDLISVWIRSRTPLDSHPATVPSARAGAG